MSKNLKLFVYILTIAIGVETHAVNPMATYYSWNECQGSARPYPVPRQAVEYPDTFTPVMINHVGRHGARFAASPSYTRTLLDALDSAHKAGTLTSQGKKLKSLVEKVIAISDNQWGALDSIGALEQRGIASRMYASYPELFGSEVAAVSSYVPRCVMSMYEFMHDLARCNPKIRLTACSGPQYSSLLRFFDHNSQYKSVVEGVTYRDVFDGFEATTIPMTQLRRVFGRDFDIGADSVEIAKAEYSFLAGLQSIGITVDIRDYFTQDEYNALWQIANMRQYLDRTATVLSAEPAQIAMPLLENLISTTDAFISGKADAVPVMLRFGHAETLMPLLSLMRLPGCYYMTRNFDTVGRNWCNFDIVPMAANLQMILFRSDSGIYYVRIDLNERPVAFMPGSDGIYVPWSQARMYFIRCLPAVFTQLDQFDTAHYRGGF